MVDLGCLMVLIGEVHTLVPPNMSGKKEMFNTGATKRFLIQHDKQHYAVGRSHGEDV